MCPSRSDGILPLVIWFYEVHWLPPNCEAEAPDGDHWARHRIAPQFRRSHFSTRGALTNRRKLGGLKSVGRLLAGKTGYVSVTRPDVRMQDVIEQLEADDVSALVVSDDGKTILGINSAADIVRS